MNIKLMIKDYLFNDESKAKIIQELNSNINIPIINEKTEGKIIDSIYDCFEQVLRATILKK